MATGINTNYSNIRLKKRKARQVIKRHNSRRHNLNYNGVIKRPRRVKGYRPYTTIVINTLPFHHYRHFGTYYYFRPYNYYHGLYPYYYSFHVPFVYTGPFQYSWNTYEYYRFLKNNSFDHAIYMNWIFNSVENYDGNYANNSCQSLDNYPFWIYNGYAHRYSRNDRCNYQLIDKYSMTVVESYFGQMCNQGYDNCASLRDNLNGAENAYRFSCAETFRPQNYEYFNYYKKEYSHKGGYSSQAATDDYYYDAANDLYYDYEYDEYDVQNEDDKYYSDPALESKYYSSGS